MGKGDTTRESAREPSAGESGATPWHRFGQLVGRVLGPTILFVHRFAWVVVAVLGAVVIVLGMQGFDAYARSQGESLTHSDAFYLAVQLFAFESGGLSGPLDIRLEIARFLGPIVAMGAAARALTMVFYDGFQRFLLRLFGHGHVVVCGIGRKGARLVEELRQRGEWVVVVESDRDNGSIARCRSLGATLIIGAADDEWVLKRACVHRAATLVLVVGADGDNIQTAVLARGLNAARTHGRLRCIVHVQDPALRRMLAASELVSREDDPFEIEFFNAFDVTARVMMLEAESVQGSARSATGRRDPVLIAGCTRLAEALLIRLGQDASIDNGSRGDKIDVTVLDRSATTLRSNVEQRHPTLAAAANVSFVDLDVRSPSLGDHAWLSKQLGTEEVAAAYVCLDDDAVALSTALTLARALQKHRAPVVVGMTENAGLATALRRRDADVGLVEGVRAVGLLDTTCDADLVLGGSWEILARAYHDGYLRHHRGAADADAANPSLRSWADLSEELRASNRARVRALRSQLKEVGYRIVTAAGEKPETVEFREPAPEQRATIHEKVERLAELEHERWLEERRAVKDRRGSAGHPLNGRTPLAEWGELDEKHRESNREQVRDLPSILAKVGLEIRELEPDKPA